MLTDKGLKNKRVESLHCSDAFVLSVLPPSPVFLSCSMHSKYHQNSQILIHFSNYLSCQMIEIKKTVTEAVLLLYCRRKQLKRFKCSQIFTEVLFSCVAFQLLFQLQEHQSLHIYIKKNCESKIDKKHPGKSLSLLLFLILCWKQTLLFFFHTHEMWNFYVFKHILTKIPFCLKILFKKTFC